MPKRGEGRLAPDAGEGHVKNTKEREPSFAALEKVLMAALKTENRRLIRAEEAAKSGKADLPADEAPSITDVDALRDAFDWINSKNKGLAKSSAKGALKERMVGVLDDLWKADALVNDSERNAAYVADLIDRASEEAPEVEPASTETAEEEPAGEAAELDDAISNTEEELMAAVETSKKSIVAGSAKTSGRTTVAKKLRAFVAAVRKRFPGDKAAQSSELAQVQEAVVASLVDAESSDADVANVEAFADKVFMSVEVVDDSEASEAPVVDAVVEGEVVNADKLDADITAIENDLFGAMTQDPESAEVAKLTDALVTITGDRYPDWSLKEVQEHVEAGKQIHLEGIEGEIESSEATTLPPAEEEFKPPVAVTSRELKNQALDILLEADGNILEDQSDVKAIAAVISGIRNNVPEEGQASAIIRFRKELYRKIVSGSNRKIDSPALNKALDELFDQSVALVAEDQRALPAVEADFKPPVVPDVAPENNVDVLGSDSGQRELSDGEKYILEMNQSIPDGYNIYKDTGELAEGESADKLFLAKTIAAIEKNIAEDESLKDEITSAEQQFYTALRNRDKNYDEDLAEKYIQELHESIQGSEMLEQERAGAEDESPDTSRLSMANYDSESLNELDDSPDSKVSQQEAARIKAREYEVADALIQSVQKGYDESLSVAIKDSQALVDVRTVLRDIAKDFPVYAVHIARRKLIRTVRERVSGDKENVNKYIKALLAAADRDKTETIPSQFPVPVETGEVVAVDIDEAPHEAYQKKAEKDPFSDDEESFAAYMEEEIENRKAREGAAVTELKITTRRASIESGEPVSPLVDVLTAEEILALPPAREVGDKTPEKEPPTGEPASETPPEPEVSAGEPARETLPETEPSGADIDKIIKAIVVIDENESAEQREARIYSLVAEVRSTMLGSEFNAAAISDEEKGIIDAMVENFEHALSTQRDEHAAALTKKGTKKWRNYKMWGKLSAGLAVPGLALAGVAAPVTAVVAGAYATWRIGEGLIGAGQSRKREKLERGYQSDQIDQGANGEGDKYYQEARGTFAAILAQENRHDLTKKLYSEAEGSFEYNTKTIDALASHVLGREKSNPESREAAANLRKMIEAQVDAQGLEGAEREASISTLMMDVYNDAQRQHLSKRGEFETKIREHKFFGKFFDKNVVGSQRAGQKAASALFYIGVGGMVRATSKLGGNMFAVFGGARAGGAAFDLGGAGLAGASKKWGSGEMAQKIERVKQIKSDDLEKSYNELTGQDQVDTAALTQLHERALATLQVKGLNRRDPVEYEKIQAIVKKMETVEIPPMESATSLIEEYEQLSTADVIDNNAIGRLYEKAAFALRTKGLEYNNPVEYDALGNLVEKIEAEQEPATLGEISREAAAEKGAKIDTSMAAIQGGIEEQLEHRQKVARIKRFRKGAKYTAMAAGALGALALGFAFDPDGDGPAPDDGTPRPIDPNRPTPDIVSPIPVTPDFDPGPVGPHPPDVLPPEPGVEPAVVVPDVLPEPTPEAFNAATVQKGEGIEHAFYRQFRNNDELAKAYGFDPDGEETIQKFSSRTSHVLAQKAGYVSADGTEDIHVRPPGEIAYVISGDEDNFAVREYKMDKNEGPIWQETHTKDKNNEFESPPDGYEYTHDDALSHTEAKVAVDTDIAAEVAAPEVAESKFVLEKLGAKEARIGAGDNMGNLTVEQTTKILAKEDWKYEQIHGYHAWIKPGAEDGSFDISLDGKPEADITVAVGDDGSEVITQIGDLDISSQEVYSDWYENQGGNLEATGSDLDADLRPDIVAPPDVVDISWDDIKVEADLFGGTTADATPEWNKQLDDKSLAYILKGGQEVSGASLNQPAFKEMMIAGLDKNGMEKVSATAFVKLLSTPTPDAGAIGAKATEVDLKKVLDSWAEKNENDDLDSKTAWKEIRFLRAVLSAAKKETGA